MKKRLCSLLLAFCMLLSLIPAISTPVAATVGSPNTDWYTNHSSETTFTISTVEDLFGLAKLVNDGTDSFQDKTIKLSDTFDNTGKPLTTSIGAGRIPFKGTFDGNGKTVELNISDVLMGGLFGYVDGGTVQNVSTSGSVSGNALAGGVVGSNNRGTVTNCYAKGTVSGSTAGGVVGYNYNSGIVTNCYAMGTVSGSYAGGVVGYNPSGTVSNCYATGDVSGTNAGGVVGCNQDTVTNCYCPNTNGKIIGSGNGTDCDTFDASQKLTNGEGKSLVDALNEYVAKNPTVNDIKLFQWEVVENNTPSFAVPDTPWYNDSDKEFIIENVKQLEELASLVNSGNSFKGKTIKLSDTFYNTGKPLTTPIGTGTNYFQGTFDGNGKTVELNISDVDYAGLFGYINNGGTVQNVSTSGSISTSGSVSANNSAGGVVGYSGGGTVTNCSAMGDVSGKYAGGVVGMNYGDVTNCYATGNVSATDKYGYVGGVLGYNHGTVTNCYATGDVSGKFAGGVVAYNNGGTVTNCYATGDVSTTDKYGYVGGVVGYTYKNSTVTNCYCPDGTNIGSDDTSCDTFDATTLKLTNGEGKSLVDALNGYVSQNPTVNDIKLFQWEVVKNNMPTLVDPDTPWYNDTDTEFTIKNVKQLEELASLVNSGTDSFKGKTIKLSDTFDNTGKPLTTSIGAGVNDFNGTFDGNNKTVELNISGVDYAGLFGIVGDGTVQNVSTSGNVSGRNAGGVVGCIVSGTVINCYATGNVSATDNNSYSYVGGVVGFNGSGTVTNCYATGDVSGDYVGGVVGFNPSGKVSNCYATGNVTGKYAGGGVVGESYSTVLNCYTTGNVTSTHHAGEMVGFNEDGTVENCDTFDAEQKLTNSDKSLVDALNEYVSQNPTVNNIKLFQWEVVENNMPTLVVSDTSWYNDTDTEFTIKNAKQLEELASLVNSGTDSFKGKTIKLANDINLENKEFAPIGNRLNEETNAFQGTFDGNGKTISNLYINRPMEDAPENYDIGLFGVINEGATVKNLVVSGSVTGCATVGGIVACTFGSNVTNCVSCVSVSGLYYVGGIVGNNDQSNVTNCINSGTVSGAGNRIGGIVGNNYSTYNQKAEVKNCVNYGTVTHTNYNCYGNTGAIGNNEGPGSISNCYYLKDSSNYNNSYGTAKTADELHSADMVTSLNTFVSEYNTQNTNLPQLSTWKLDSSLLTLSFVIVQNNPTEKKKIAKPTEGSKTYIFNGSEQTYVFGSFAENAGYSVKNNKQTNAGTYTIEVALNDTKNTVWDDGSANGSTDPLYFEFIINKREIAKPTKGSGSYTYNLKQQTYSFGKFDSTYCQVLNNSNKRTDAGTQSVVVALKDKSNTVWADDKSTTDYTLTNAFTIRSLRVPVPIADPRSFVADGSQKTYMALYLIDGKYYNYDGVFYNTTNNTRKEIGTQTVSVTPAKNCVWEDGTTTTKKYTFTVEQQRINAGIYFLKNNATGNLVSYYDFGSYLYDDSNPNNTKVSTHYTPNLYNLPKNATYTVYVCSDPQTKKNSVEWNSLTYTKLQPGIYYLYAKVKAPGYQDYETPTCWFQVCSSPIQATSCKEFKYKAYYQSSVFVVNYTLPISYTKTEHRDFKSRMFSNLEQAKASMLSDLNNGSSRVIMSVKSCNVETMFSSSNKSALYPSAQKKSVQNSLPIEEQGEALTLTNTELEGMGIKTVDFYQTDPEFFGGLATVPTTTEEIDLTAALSLLETHATDSKPTVSFNIGYTDKEYASPADVPEEDLIAFTQTVAFGQTLTQPETEPRIGYTFKGWYYIPVTVDMTQELSIEKDGIAWDFANDLVFSDMTLFALWTKNSNSNNAKINLPTTEHGKVLASPSAASAGKTITLTVSPETGYQLGTLTVTDVNGNKVALKTVQLGETYTFSMPSSDITVSASFVAESTATMFVDVKENDFFYNAVLWAAKNGITSGVDASHFAPTAITTRAQMVTFLWRASGSPEPTATTCVFTDVNADSYYAKAVMWGYENGYVKGVSATSFAPDATVTRGQTVALLARMDGVKDEGASAIHSFVDVSATDYYNNAVAWAVNQNITKGISENTFAPNDDCTRGQIVTFLYRDFVK